MIIKAHNISKSYTTDSQKLNVLNELSLQMEKGEFLGIFGASGTGKSTLLHILGGLDAPDKGQVFVDEHNIYSFSDKKLAKFRNMDVGFVFQFYHLLPEFTALENVMLPLLVANKSKKEAKAIAQETLAQVGLDDRMSHYPHELSGGEQQRVALARAIVMKPSIILADEPTGNLDQENGKKIINLLHDINKKHNMTVVMVTHNPELTKNMTRILRLKDGKLQQMV
ncbi:ABC transporter ATP-binding protein [bacterium]|nr:ABC transporter ATP-binding protein [bacterium]